MKTLASLLLVLVSYSAFSQGSLADSANVTCWKISPYGLVSAHATDTAYTGFQIVDQNIRASFHQSNLGAINSPFYPSMYYQQLKNPFIASNYRHHSYSNSINYYNTKKPYSGLSLHSGPKKEVALDFLHTQNVNEKFNFCILINALSSPGSYINQDQKEMNVAFTSWYKHKAFVFSAFANSYTSKRQENGGITDPFYIEDTTLRPQQVNFKLQNAKSKYLAVEMGFNSSVGFFKRPLVDSLDSYIFSGFYNANVTDYTYRYTDYLPFYTNPIVDAEIKNLYYPKNIFSDTTDERRNHYQESHRAGVRFNPDTSVLFAIDGYVAANYKREIFKNIVYNHASRETEVGTLFFESGVSKKKGTFNSDFFMHYGLKGYRANELKVQFNSQIFVLSDSLSLLDFSFGYDKFKTSYFNELTLSNHFYWRQKLKMEENLSASLVAKYKETGSLGIHFNQYGNFAYIKDTLAIQNPDRIKAFAFEAGVRFKFWQLHSFTSSVLQFSEESEILGIPRFSLYESFYHEYEWVRGVMVAQIGIDCYYSSLYFAPQYVPVLGQFIPQNNKKIGNYPLVDVFVNAKIKNARVYIKMDHVNYRLFGSKYYASPAYPFAGRTLRFGISWNFYN